MINFWFLSFRYYDCDSVPSVCGAAESHNFRLVAGSFFRSTH